MRKLGCKHEDLAKYALRISIVPVTKIETFLQVSANK